MTIAACLKWVDRRPEVDPLTGAVGHDGRSGGASDADKAALEWALRLGGSWSDDVTVVTAGPPAAESLLHEGLALGAARAVRVDLPAGTPSDVVAAAVAEAVTACQFVMCGDLSLDRGSGAVPAYLAARLGAEQALGLVALEIGERGAVRGLRRLDGGRRERLHVTAPAVCSVEGSTARLRRAPLPGVLAARRASVTVMASPGSSVQTNGHRLVRPFRPRARALAAPHGDVLDRLRSLTAATVAGATRTAETLEPDAAAARILHALTEWGYGPGDSTTER
jgi:electron transfer flavoprotein beta subunit